MNLETALDRIKELETENKRLRTELEYYKKKKNAGRKKHNEKWMNSYNDLAIKYEKGMTISEIVDEGTISRRTAYRYKSFFDEINKSTQTEKYSD